MTRTIKWWTEKILDNATSGTSIDLDLQRKFVAIHEMPGRRGNSVPAAAVRKALETLALSKERSPVVIFGGVIVGDLDLSGMESLGTIHFENCAFTGDILLGFAVVATLTFDDCALQRIDAPNLKVKNNFRLVNSFVHGPIRLPNAQIGQDLILDGTRVLNQVLLDGSTIEGVFAARVGFYAQDGLSALYAKFGRQASLRGAELGGREGDFALQLEGSRVDGSLFLDGGMQVYGDVSLAQCSVSGIVSFASSKIVCPRGILFDGARFQNGLLCNDGFSLNGLLQARDLVVTGTVNFRDASFTGAHDRSLSFDRARISGALFLGPSSRYVGTVHALGMVVQGELDIRGSTFTAQSETALTVAFSSMDGLQLDEGSLFEGQLVLAGASIGTLSTNMASSLPGPSALIGAKVSGIRGSIRRNPALIDRWLEDCAIFSPQPWHVFAAILDQNGQHGDAKRMRRKAAHRSAVSSKNPLRFVYGAVAGYGYHPLLALVWLMVLGVGAFGFLTANADHFRPNDRSDVIVSGTADTSISGSTECDLYPADASFPCFNPAAYAVEVAIPASGVKQRAAWSPDGSPLLSVAVTSMVICGWVFSAILLAGFTGLLRKS